MHETKGVPVLVSVKRLARPIGLRVFRTPAQPLPLGERSHHPQPPARFYGEWYSNGLDLRVNTSEDPRASGVMREVRSRRTVLAGVIAFMCSTTLKPSEWSPPASCTSHRRLRTRALARDGNPFFLRCWTCFHQRLMRVSRISPFFRLAIPLRYRVQILRVPTASTS